MEVEAGKGVVVEVEAMLGAGVTVDARVAIEGDAAVGVPAQPDKVRKKANQITKIRSIIILINYFPRVSG